MTDIQGRIFIEQSGLIASGAIMLTDHVLPVDGRMELQLIEAGHVIILPVTGDLYYEDQQGEAVEINVGELKVSSTPVPATLVLTNPYLSEAVNFLEIRIQDATISQALSFDPLIFDFDAHRNLLMEIISPSAFNDLPFHFSIGRFAGRAETIYEMKNEQTLFFAFVIAGAFEIEGRLLHPRDGLTLSNAKHVEIEALSNHAILLVIESQA